MTAVLETTGLGKVHGEGAAAVTALADVDLTVAPGRVRRRHRPERLRQVDAAEPARRPRPADQRRGARARRAPGRRGRGAARPAAPQRGRLRVPVLQPDRQPHGRRQRRAAGAARRRPRARGAPPRGRAARAPRPRGDRARACPATSPAASSSASRSRARWSTGRACCSPTSRPATSTPPPRARSSRVLRERHADGQTIVLVTHDMRVASAAERVVAMRDGRIVGETLPTGGRGRRAQPRREPGGLTCCAAALRVIRADLRAARSTPSLTGLVVAFALGALVVTLHGRATLDDPYDRLFEATNGAHVTAVSDSRGRPRRASPRCPASRAPRGRGRSSRSRRVRRARATRSA